MKKISSVYLIGLIASLAILTGCERNTKDPANQLLSPSKTDANEWQPITRPTNHSAVPSNVPAPNSLLKTSVQGPSGPIDLEVSCNKHLIQVAIHLNQNEVSSTPLYSNLDGRWSHTFHVDFMNSVKSINERLPARQTDLADNISIVSNVSPAIFEGPESHLRFQTASKNSITVFYDEQLRALTKACKDRP